MVLMFHVQQNSTEPQLATEMLSEMLSAHINAVHLPSLSASHVSDPLRGQPLKLLIFSTFFPKSTPAAFRIRSVTSTSTPGLW